LQTEILPFACTAKLTLFNYKIAMEFHFVRLFPFVFNNPKQSGSTLDLSPECIRMYFSLDSRFATLYK
jgi:hypothetical protein